MADPIIADHFRAQVIMRGKTGADEDVFVNSFVFRNDLVAGDLEAVGIHVVNALRNFYTTPTASGRDVESYLSGGVIAGPAEVKVYDLGQAAPRFPYQGEFELLGMSSATPLPTQVAACLSYYAGRSLPRRRGRVFLGPLSSGVISEVALEGPRFDAQFIQTVTEAADRLRVENGEDVTWCLLSQRDGAAFPITGGWMDNRPDILSNRAIETRTRSLWGAPQTA